MFNDATTGAPVSNVTVGIGVGLRTATINMITPVISYSEFEVIGIDVNFSIRQDNFTPAGGTVPVDPREIVARLLLTSAVTGGSINLMYGNAVDVGMAAQLVSYPGTMGLSRSIRGLRANVVQDKTNQTAIALDAMLHWNRV